MEGIYKGIRQRSSLRVKDLQAKARISTVTSGRQNTGGVKPLCCRSIERLGRGNRLAAPECALALRAWPHKPITQQALVGLMFRAGARGNLWSSSAQ